VGGGGTGEGESVNYISTKAQEAPRFLDFLTALLNKYTLNLFPIFRRVMAEQRALERIAQLAAKEEDEREQDARLETLRKSTRRRLGIGMDFFISGREIFNLD
jgi:hypothetical protein